MDFISDDQNFFNDDRRLPSNGNVHGSATEWAVLLRENLAALNSGKEIPDTICQAAPRRRHAGTERELLIGIAQLLYPAPTDSTIAPVIKYEKDIILLRKAISDQNEQRELENNETWSKRIRSQGPWDETKDLWTEAVPAQPMPVTISDRESLSDIFSHLSLGGELTPSLDAQILTTGNESYYEVETLEFEKGIVYKDGRLDLCKK